MIDVPAEGWSFATAREPARFGACEVNGVPGVEHAVGARGTLCGISERHTTRYSHLFDPGALQSCRRCRQQAEAAPTEPCGQERLHDKVQGAAQGQARDDLLAALRRGAKVALWISGPSASLAKHYAKVDELTDGAGPAAEAFAAATTIGLARVEDGPWRFIVVLPEDGGSPLVARGPRDLP
ncbi:hypothetical protein ACFVFH_22685 [Streptomyces sp. NPDC057697]|uniref:hypothetical protein n=1 Tax=Streptomyces sp. NPDC057697 TaxID=3346219 RepID=UPI00367C18D6